MKTVYSEDPLWDWIVKMEGNKYRIGGWNRRTGRFYPICSCSDYQKAQQICLSLKNFDPGHDFVVKGVE